MDELWLEGLAGAGTLARGSDWSSRGCSPGHARHPCSHGPPTPSPPNRGRGALEDFKLLVPRGWKQAGDTEMEKQWQLAGPHCSPGWETHSFLPVGVRGPTSPLPGELRACRQCLHPVGAGTAPLTLRPVSSSCT